MDQRGPSQSGLQPRSCRCPACDVERCDCRSATCEIRRPLSESSRETVCSDSRNPRAGPSSVRRCGSTTEPDEVRRDTLQLAHQHADYLSAFGDLETEQFLTRHHVGEVVAEWIEVIHPVSDHDALLVFLVLEQLLHAGVEIADVRGCLYHHFAVEHELE